MTGSILGKYIFLQAIHWVSHLKLIGFANFSPHFVQNVFVNFQLMRDLEMPAMEESFKLKFAKIVLRSLKEDLDISSFLIFLLKNFT